MRKWEWEGEIWGVKWTEETKKVRVRERKIWESKIVEIKIKLKTKKTDALYEIKRIFFSKKEKEKEREDFLK